MLDNGGPVAIKGFNFQKASIVLVAILNYKKEGFSIIPEAKDDFEVEIKEQRFFVQAKSSALSLSKITKSKVKGEHVVSILEKNITHDGINSMYYIFNPYNKFNGINKLVRKIDYELCNPIFMLNEGDYAKVTSDINSNVFSPKEIQEKLQKFAIYETPFPDNLEIAITNLIGLMSKQDMVVDKQRGHTAISEISLCIDIKSEKKYSYTNINEKMITSNYFDNIFKTNAQIILFDEFLSKMKSINTIYKNKIRIKRLSIETLYSETKNEIIKFLDSIKLDLTLNEEDLVRSVKKIISDNSLAEDINDEYLLIAIIIEILLDMEAA